MNWGKRLAIAMVAMSVAASVGYAAAGDWRRSVYWICSAGLIACVTF